MDTQEHALAGITTNPEHSPWARLRMWRSGIGLDLTEAAEALGCAKSTLSRLEAEKGKPGRDLAVRIESVTGLPVPDWTEATP